MANETESFKYKNISVTVFFSNMINRSWFRNKNLQSTLKVNFSSKYEWKERK
jgi:hypothetical protein